MVIIGERVCFILEGAELWYVWIVSSLKLGLTQWSLIIYYALEPYLMRAESGCLPTIPGSSIFHLNGTLAFRVFITALRII